ncbi:MAG: N-formylglutamate amidohydrolase [Inquilinaceae bacterium]
MNGRPAEASVPEEVPVLAIEEPASPGLPLVFDSPHSGTAMPAGSNHVAGAADLATAVDHYVHELFGTATDHGAALLHALFPRTYIDANRAATDIDPALIEGTWPGPLAPTEKSASGFGLIRRLVLPEVPMYDRRLSVAEIQARIDRYYAPYHAALAALLDDRHTRFGAVFHVDCHSMKEYGNAMNTDAGQRRADMVLGDRKGTTCDPAMTAMVADFLKGCGYGVTVNEPYQGAELVRRYGRPAENRHSLQIELNRALYLDEATFTRGPGFAALKTDLDALIAALAGFVRARLG